VQRGRIRAKLRGSMSFIKFLLKMERKGRKGVPGIIRVRVKDLGQLFNSMDPSPFEERDLDEDAEAFIESWAFEYPASSTLSLEVIVEQDPPQGMDEAFLGWSIHHFYEHKADIKGREFRQLMREGRVALLIGLLSLGLCFVASGFLANIQNQTLGRFLGEGFLIAGWVSMWKPIQIHLYDWWPLLRKARVYAKMSRMKVSLKKVSGK